MLQVNPLINYIVTTLIDSFVFKKHEITIVIDDGKENNFNSHLVFLVTKFSLNWQLLVCWEALKTNRFHSSLSPLQFFLILMLFAYFHRFHGSVLFVFHCEKFALFSLQGDGSNDVRVLCKWFPEHGQNFHSFLNFPTESKRSIQIYRFWWFISLKFSENLITIWNLYKCVIKYLTPWPFWK